MKRTLEQYEQAEHEVSLLEARTGLRVHAVVTVVVVTTVVAVNVLVAGGFPWSAFVAGGMGLGLFFHWLGYRRLETDLTTRQHRIESRARDLSRL